MLPPKGHPCSGWLEVGVKGMSPEAVMAALQIKTAARSGSANSPRPASGAHPSIDSPASPSTPPTQDQAGARAPGSPPSEVSSPETSSGAPEAASDAQGGKKGFWRGAKAWAGRRLRRVLPGGGSHAPAGPSPDDLQKAYAFPASHPLLDCPQGD